MADDGIPALFAEGIGEGAGEHPELAPVVRARPGDAVFHSLVARRGVGGDTRDAGAVNLAQQGRTARGVHRRENNHIGPLVDGLVRLLGLQVHVPVAVVYLYPHAVKIGDGGKPAHVGGPVGMVAGL